MHSLNTLLTAGALASVALAKPIPHTSPVKRGVSVTGTVARALPKPAIQLANAYRKYGAPVPQTISTEATNGTGSVPAIPAAQDVFYLCEIDIGGQTLNVDFDTGSADLWVFSSELNAASQKGHDIYDPSKSKTSKKLAGSTWKIQYGDGSGASGDVYTDDVTVGGIKVKGQAVELASKISSQFSEDTTNDGLLGLSFSSINTVQPKAQTTWFDSGVEQGIFDKNVFTVDLKHNAPGSYDFGFIDDSKYDGEIVYTEINSAQGFWEFTGTGYGIGNGEFTESSIDAIADTGTTLLLMDDAIVKAYYKEVKGAKLDQTQGGYVFDCSTTLPEFTLGIGEGKSTIPGDLMSLGSVGDGSNNCFGGIQSNEGIGLSIYGDVWLKAVLAVFDSDNQQFGYAPKAGTGSQGSNSGDNSNNGSNNNSDDGADSGSDDGADDGLDDGSDDGFDFGGYRS